MLIQLGRGSLGRWAELIGALLVVAAFCKTAFASRIRAFVSPDLRRGLVGRRALSVGAFALALLAGVVSPFAPIFSPDEAVGDDSQTGRISGKVVSQQGDPVPAATVWLVKARRGNHQCRTVVTDDQGRFEFKDIGPGGFRLAAVADGKSYAGVTRTAAGDQIVDEGDMKLTVTPAAELKLRVTDKLGQPIEGAEVDGIAWRRDSTNWFWLPIEDIAGNIAPACSDGTGELTVESLPSPSTVKVRLKHPKFARNIVEASLPPPDDLLREVVLPLGSPLVIQAVEAATGKPATDTTIGVSGIGDGLDFSYEPVDQQGRLTVRVARANHIEVHAMHPTLLPREWFTFRDWDQETGPTREVRFELVRKTRVGGRVIDESGFPVAGACVSLIGSRKVLGTTKTQSDGSYTIEGPEGNAELELMSNGPFYAATKQTISVTLSTDQDAEAPDLVARRVPSLRGIVVLPDGTLAAQALVLEQTSSSANSVLTDEQGRFELPGDSSYQRGIIHVSACHLTERLSGEGTTDFEGLLRGEEIRVELLPETTIQGRLTDVEGRPVDGVRVELESWARHGRRSTGKTAGRCYTNTSGAFRFAGVSRALEYRIHVRDNSGVEVSAVKAVKLDTDVVEANLPPPSSTKDLMRLAAPAKVPELECAAWIGQPVSLEATRGKVVLLDFWATWCSPCVRELPGIERLHELYAERGLVIVGLHHNSVPEDQVRQFAQEHGLRYSIGLDTAEGATCGRYGVHAFPTKVLIDRDGRLRATELSGNFLAAVRREILYGK